MFYDHLDVSECRTDMSNCNIGVLVYHMAILIGPSPVSYDTVFVGIMAILNEVSLHNPGNYAIYIVVLVSSWYVL